LKGQFVANVSHEVRTPLTGVVGLAELLSIDETLPAEAHESALRIFNASQQLLTVVNEILNFSKLEAGRVTIENIPYSVSKILDEVRSLYLPQAQQKGLALEVNVENSVPAEVMGDPTKISQSLMNLVSNALKFTSRGGIEMAAEVVDHKLRFSVTDTGIGVPTQARPTLFTAFTQADATMTRKYGGTGLGLAIVKQYIELMGGEVGFISDDGRGSTFWFSVPLQTREDANAKS
jgi:signal transduction histidine kinase